MISWSVHVSYLLQQTVFSRSKIRPFSKTNWSGTDHVVFNLIAFSKQSGDIQTAYWEWSPTWAMAGFVFMSCLGRCEFVKVKAVPRVC